MISCTRLKRASSRATTCRSSATSLIGTAEGAKSDDDITVFDSTGLAIQDLAIALAALERADELGLPAIPL